MGLNSLSPNAIVLLCLVELLIKNGKTLSKPNKILWILLAIFLALTFPLTSIAAPIFIGIQLPMSKTLPYSFHSIK